MAPLEIAYRRSTCCKPRPDTRRPKLKVTEVDLDSWFAVATPGHTLEYHRGDLAMDRVFGSLLDDDGRKELDRRAKAALALSDGGKVDLVQRRLGQGEFSYLCIARTRRDKKSCCGIRP